MIYDTCKFDQALGVLIIKLINFLDLVTQSSALSCHQSLRNISNSGGKRISVIRTSILKLGYMHTMAKFEAILQSSTDNICQFLIEIIIFLLLHQIFPLFSIFLVKKEGTMY